METEKQQQQHDMAAENLISEMLETVFLPHKGETAKSKKTARELIEQYGDAVCERQLEYFGRRCEIAATSKRGLDNPAGLYVKSVKEDWAPPPETEKQTPVQKTWYTEEERTLFIR